jgi:hypothetical protein
MVDLDMKRLSLIPVCTVMLLLLLVFVPPVTNVSGDTPPVEYGGTSPPISYNQGWSLGLGYLHAGVVIQWHWNATDNLSFQLAYTRVADLQTVVIHGLLTDDGIVVNDTGWYDLNWFNFGLADVTVSYLVDIYTPMIWTNTIVDGLYLGSRTLAINGLTEGFATGVLLGTDALQLHKANMAGSNWEGTVALAEGRNTIIIQSYYWLRPFGAENITLTKTINITVDSVPSPLGVPGHLPPVVYRGTSSTLNPNHAWSLDMGYLHAGVVIQWHWNATDNLRFRVAYTRVTDLRTFVIPSPLIEGGIVVNVTGWYNLNWFNYGLANDTVNYLVDVYTPMIGTTTIVDGLYSNSRTLVVNGVTEGFATGVLVGTDALHLHKANLTGRNWEGTVALVEGRNAIIMQSYYWLRPFGAENITLTKGLNVTLDTVLPAVSIVSPSNGTSIRGRAVPIYWNCSDAVGLMKVDLRVDNGSWTTVDWGDTLGLGYTPIGLPSGEHTIDIRGTDRAGNQVTSSTTVRTNSNDWSLGGPMYGLPTIGIILAAIVLSLVAYFAYARPPKEDVPPPAPVEPLKDSKEPPQVPPQQ